MFTGSRGRFRIGVLVPYTNTNLEPDLATMRPNGISYHVARIAGYETEGVPGLDEMQQMGSAAPVEAIRLLSPTRPDIILYGCTSATLALGPSGDRAFAQQLRDAVGCTVLTASNSLIWAARRLGARKLSIVTPYSAELTRYTAEFFEKAGFEIAEAVHPGSTPDSLGQGEILPDQVVALATSRRHADAEAIVVSCTDLRAVEAITTIEALTNLPVITSNQALCAAALEELKLPLRTIPGRLAAT